MNKTTRDLAAKAGFIFWTDEPHARCEIDWSCDYDRELVEFERLVRRDEANKALTLVREVMTQAAGCSSEAGWWLQHCEAGIEERLIDLKRRNFIG